MKYHIPKIFCILLLVLLTQSTSVFAAFPGKMERLLTMVMGILLSSIPMGAAFWIRLLTEVIQVGRPMV